MGARLGPLRVDFEWRTTALVLMLLPVLLALGAWQLSREAEKRELAARFEERRALAPQRLDDSMAERPASALAYLPVRLRGRYVPTQYLLLDNRVRDGRFGYEAVQLFELDGGGYALVNRGWLAGDPARRALPAVSSPAGTVALTGHIYVPPGEPFLLAEPSLAADDWPRVAQALESEARAEVLADEVAAPVFPWSVRIDAGQPGALAPVWQVINVQPEKHRGYAVQWFAMAAVLLLFFILRSSNLLALLRGDERRIEQSHE